MKSRKDRDVGAPDQPYGTALGSMSANAPVPYSNISMESARDDNNSYDTVPQADAGSPYCALPDTSTGGNYQALSVASSARDESGYSQMNFNI